MANINTIKITQLQNIGANLNGNTLFPVVGTTGSNVTEKANVNVIATFMLTEAGNSLPQALVSTFSQSVINAAQPNITSVGTLNINTLHISGGQNGQYIQTDGTGNLAWVSGGGSGNGEVGGANTQIQFNDSGSFGGVTGFTYNKSTDRLTTGNLTVASNGSMDYLSLTHDLHANVVYGNYIYGDGSNITNISVGAGSYIQNGNSNVKVSANSSVTVSVAGNANIFTITGTGATVDGTFSASGNANVGNLGVGTVVATHLSGEGGNISNIGNANYANSANTANSANVSNLATYAGTANSVAVANVVGIGNIAVVSLSGSSTNVLYGNGTFAEIPTPVTTGNISFDGTLMYETPGATETSINISPSGPEGWSYIQVPVDSEANATNLRIHNDAGNVEVAAGQFSTSGPLFSWYFNNQGSIDIPSQSASYTKGRIQSANGYPTLLAYGSGGHGGPELDWMDGDNPQTMDDPAVLRNTMYLNDEGLYIGINENSTVGSFSGHWGFDTLGNTNVPGSIVFPSASDIMENGGSLQLESPSNVIIRTNKNAFGQDFVFADDGTLTVAGGIDAQVGNDLNLRVFNPNSSGGVTFLVQNYDVDLDNRTTQFEVQPANIVVSTDFGNNRYQWSFNNTGGITFPDTTVQSTAYTGVAEPGFTLQAGNFNAVAGGRYGVDTYNADGPVTATLPATPNNGDAVFFADAGGYAQNGALTIDAGTNSIMDNGTTMTVTTSNQSVGLFWNGRTWRTYNAG